MYRQIIIPTIYDHSIELPENLYGKKVEVTVMELTKRTTKSIVNKKLPNRLINKAFWEDITYNPNFPSIEEIRQTSWPKSSL